MHADKHRKIGPADRPDVQRAVSNLFPNAERASVLAALKRCRSGHNAGRVHRAILALSFRSVREVERLVEIANRSLRDLTRLAGVDWTS
jgi:hypothetical protein